MGKTAGERRLLRRGGDLQGQIYSQAGGVEITEFGMPLLSEGLWKAWKNLFKNARFSMNAQ
jgi:hypothetical protein